MPKGKTNAPLNILVTDRELRDSMPFRTLEQQGHQVTLYDSTVPTALSPRYDRIYGPNCYRMTTDLLPFLPLSLKQARLEKKARKEKA